MSKPKSPDVEYHAARMGNEHGAAALNLLAKQHAALEKRIAALEPAKPKSTKSTTK